MTDYSKYSAAELVKMLGGRFKDYRLRAKLTQREVAESTALTIPTIQKFENGQSNNVSLRTFLLLMKSVGCINDLEQIMPNEPESLYTYKDNCKKMQRVRHKKA